MIQIPLTITIFIKIIENTVNFQPFSILLVVSIAYQGPFVKDG